LLTLASGVYPKLVEGKGYWFLNNKKVTKEGT